MSDLRTCGSCCGAGRVSLSTEHQQTLDAVRALHGCAGPTPTTSEIRAALGGTGGASDTALNQRLDALVAWGLLTRAGRRGRCVTWRAVARV